MIRRVVVQLSKTVAATAFRAASLGSSSRFSLLSSPSSSRLASPWRLLHVGMDRPNASPVTRQMINYALSHARSQRSDESYAQGLLVLEQCLSVQSSEGQDADNSRGAVLLAMSTLLAERGDIHNAIDKLQRIEDLIHCSLDIRVAALEALAGLHLVLDLNDSSSAIANKCLQLFKNGELADDGNSEVLRARVKAVKGLVELVQNNLDAAESLFEGFQTIERCAGSAAFTYGEFLVASQNFSAAKEVYQRVIEVGSEVKDSSEQCALAGGNMSPMEVLVAATCALGQLEGNLGNFAEAEDLLTNALTKTEEYFGSHHPKVGVILTCIALMFRHKARKEHSSSILIQEGLYRRAIDLMKVSPEGSGGQSKVDRCEIAAIAGEAYAEILDVQKNRKPEARMVRGWVRDAWRNRRISMEEVLDIGQPPSKVPVIDTRICRLI
ncbi:Tetratricopeptide repeat (TPR)-like superfamily protein, putative isoform 1 [Cucumis melo var. makuwa]|uniref:Uncharacterized protein LOC103486372 n=2 Tax=Cucumis melo TaxID=3656 RepID=A0A1S4DUM4_CUCME|nr:uncharacterized protein LOC103486372 isoform X2 [Cucumis melo]KAA0044104.1 Tetratricopeptide repeat (TPR)-like superfamily protein, putative isoform 1 [Cucumis melo var. makuwa]